MSSNPFFLISILISTLIAFATVAVVVETSLALFKIKQGRVRSLLRLLPFLSLLIDLIFNSFSIGFWFNPLNCSSCVQKLLLTLFFPELKEYLYTNEISLFEYLGSGISHTIFSILYLICFGMTLFLVSRKFFEGFILTRTLKSMRQNAEICNRPIENALLAVALQKNKVVIFVSDKIKIPMATYSKAIFMPKEVVEEFSQEEFEAIVAHELEHVIWRDPIVRLFSQLIPAIFWWIPTNSWQKKLEFDQEIACDQSILKYGFDENFLASALVKVTTTTAKEKTHKALCYLNNEKHPSLRRLQIMLGLASSHSKRFEWMNCAAVVISLIILLMCVLW